MATWSIAAITYLSLANRKLHVELRTHRQFGTIKPYPIPKNINLELQGKPTLKVHYQRLYIIGSVWWWYAFFTQTKDFVLRENVDGHSTRFALRGKKATLCFQADSENQKSLWVQDIWDLFFSHMLQLKGGWKVSLKGGGDFLPPEVFVDVIQTFGG